MDLFETGAASRRSHQHGAGRGPNRTVPLDTGFLVHNDRTYPNLVRLFAALGDS